MSRSGHLVCFFEGPFGAISTELLSDESLRSLSASSSPKTLLSLVMIDDDYSFFAFCLALDDCEDSGWTFGWAMLACEEVSSEELWAALPSREARSML